jgi:hypothetical protein
MDVTGVLNLARAAMPALLRSPQPRHGRFVAIVSAAAHRGRRQACRARLRPRPGQ